VIDEMNLHGKPPFAGSCVNTQIFQRKIYGQRKRTIPFSVSVALSVPFPFSEYAPTPEDPNKFFDTIAAADEAGT
jgi:hypothetical protein